MVYSKEVTAQILADFARGASAEETHKHLLDLYGKAPCINTIYTHRKSITAEQIVDELLRQQERDITKTSHEELRLKYRNELLKILLPQKILAYTKTETTNTNVNVNVTSDLLKQYENLFEEAALLENCAPQPLHTPQTHNQTGTSPTT